jgi:hypothetical protein
MIVLYHLIPSVVMQKDSGSSPLPERSRCRGSECRLAYFESVRASACETIQVSHMHIIALIEVEIILVPLRDEKAGR